MLSVGMLLVILRAVATSLVITPVVIASVLVPLAICGRTTDKENKDESKIQGHKRHGRR